MQEKVDTKIGRLLSAGIIDVTTWERIIIPPHGKENVLLQLHAGLPGMTLMEGIA